MMGTITVKTDFFMVSKDENKYRILYKNNNGYRGIYNVEKFEILKS